MRNPSDFNNIYNAQDVVILDVIFDVISPAKN